jgi:hypothetical protein
MIKIFKSPSTILRYLVLAIAVILAFTIIGSGNLRISASTLYADEQFARWVAIAMNLLVVGVALFLNILLEWFRQPRYRLSCQSGPPWQILKREGENGEIRLMFVRLRVMNVGRTFEEACEIRAEEISMIGPDLHGYLKPIVEHDPRPLKWVGRDTRPNLLNAGAFDLVDIGVRRSDSPDFFRIDFSDRGHLDIAVNDVSTIGCVIKGSIYGRRSMPRHFAIKITWTSSDFDKIDTRMIMQ